MIEQGFQVFGLNFHSPFCVCTSNSVHNQCGAAYFAKQLDIPIKILSKGDEYLEIVKNPKFGWGKNINPCIDCRIHILEKAKEYMAEIDADVIVTGEVVGQRPKSQTIRALKTIENQAGLKNKILRPLSAKILGETECEKSGLVDRERLLAIQGRRRNIQVELGRKYNLIETYCANGGCRLTDKNFAAKLRDYLKFTKIPLMKDMKWLRIGRHFRFNQYKIQCGRNEGENKSINQWANSKDIVLEMKDIVGPTVIVFHLNHDDKINENLDQIKNAAIEFAGQVLLRYSNSKEDGNAIIFKENEQQNEMIVIKKDIDFELYRI